MLRQDPQRAAPVCFYISSRDFNAIYGYPRVPDRPTEQVSDRFSARAQEPHRGTMSPTATWDLGQSNGSVVGCGIQDPPTGSEPPPIVQPDSLLSHSTNVSSTQGPPVNSLSSLSPPPESTSNSHTIDGFYRYDSPRITEDTDDLLPDTPGGAPETSGDTRPRRGPDPRFTQETALNRTSPRNPNVGLEGQLVVESQPVSAVRSNVEGEIPTPVGFIGTPIITAESPTH